MEDAISLALRQIKENLSQINEERKTTPSDEEKAETTESSKVCEAPSVSCDVKEEDTEEAVSHQDVMQSVQTKLGDLIKNDPLLYDLPTEVTLEEINSCIALEYGQAMVVNVRKADDEVMGVYTKINSMYNVGMTIVVTQNATVLDLKHAIKRHVMLKQARTGGKPHISWRYVWRRHWLYYEGQKLTEDKKPLKEYGIRNRDEVTFMKRLKEK